MIRTTIIPADTDIHLSIPEDYVGRMIEVTCYPVDELIENKDTLKPMSAFKGILTNTEATELNDYIKKSREEWNRDF